MNTGRTVGAGVARATEVGSRKVRTYRVEGLTCMDCAGRIEAAVGRLAGIHSCEVNHSNGMLTLEAYSADLDIAPVAQIVAETGHRLVVPTAARSGDSGIVGFLSFLLDSTDTMLALIAGVLTAVGLMLGWGGAPPVIRLAAYAAAIVIGGIPVARHAVQEVWVAHSLGINTLMVIAVAGAALIGEWAEAAVVVVLFALGEGLEGYAADKARGALEGLLRLVPPTAWRIELTGALTQVPVEALEIGDRILIRPGDRVSVDGTVVSGRSAVDQAAITGESIPADKGPGDEVFAGTINTFGALEVEIRRRAEDNTLNRMVALVREAQARQAPIQRFVDRFARIYTPVVTLVAVLVAGGPPLLFGNPFWGPAGWLMRALQLLVIACPCALVISTPVSVVSALAQAAARGVLVKGGHTLETLGDIEVFAFDKTGTLTEGRPVVTDVLEVCDDGSHIHQGLDYAAAVEARSSHPLARALVAEAAARQAAVYPAEDVVVLSGHGVIGRVDGQQVTVASHPFFDAQVAHSERVCIEAQQLAADGKTVMLVCHDEHVCSILAVADTPRAEAGAALRGLRALGGIRTVMLTGDGAVVARAIGDAVDVDEVRAELLPEDKVATVRQLSETGHAVAMVGDGINDAPALAQAAVGIAMGGAGADQALETADIVLMGDDLMQLPWLVRLSRRTRRVIGVNIAFALAVKALVFGLALLGVATLWMAIAADVGASLLVILNGMRLRR